MKLLLLFGSLALGILSGSVCADKHFLILISLTAALFSPLVFLYFKGFRGVFILCVLVFVFGFYNIQAKLFPQLPQHHISNFTGNTPYMITGKIVSFAKHYKRKQKVVMLCRQIRMADEKNHPVTGKIYLSIYGFSKGSVRIGDTILFKSAIRPVRNFQNPGRFDYERFLRLQGISGSAWVGIDKIQKIDTASAFDFVYTVLQKIERLRVQYVDFILTHTNRTDAGNIMASLVSGKKELISPDIRDLFSRVGTSHLLAISGLHFSIVSFLFFSILYASFSFYKMALISGMAKKTAGIATLVPLFAFGVFTGFSPSCQRAFIMILVLIVSYSREKEKDIISSISLAGLLILFLDTAALFAISFQLSFSAVISIVTGASVLQRYLPVILEKKVISRILLIVFITFFAGLGTWPLTAHYFNTVSIISLLSNIFAIPMLGFLVLPAGLAGLAIFSWLPSAAEWIIEAAESIVSLLIVILQTMVNLPFAWSRVVTLNWLEVISIYLCLAAIVLLLKGRKKYVGLSFAGALVFAAVSMGVHASGSTDNQNLNITVLDVGQGSSTVVQTPEGKTILIDGGGFSDSSRFDTGRAIIAPFLWKKRITRVDTVILTHPESDHLNGLIFILNNFHVKTLIKNHDKRTTENYHKMIQACEKHNIQIRHPSLFDHQFEIDGIQFEFVDNSDHNGSYNLNNNSLVFRLVFNDFSMLFPGDILKQREEDLSKQDHIHLKSQVILAPHHGSSSSSTKVFLEKVKPESVLIACGWNNKYGFPDEKVVNRYKSMGARIFQTDANGAIMLSTDGNRYTINTYIQP